MAQPPRQPRDFEGLLKFCMEATKAEDAPEDPESALRGMDTERRQWLEQAFQSMSVDVIKGNKCFNFKRLVQTKILTFESSSNND